ncbi:glycosyltransferase family 4 protein [Enterococcus casseliflavus]|uniref:glycosyltransferase n=1 Tax=Enterococcus casseliflavus TaxID=37734 RepID=UPI00191B4651|nr:glycosyltransferase [Enterococcus casseliflavus]QQU18956.1 glycosyltransferase family 4 protein [Enterococcus casseliflavus]
MRGVYLSQDLSHAGGIEKKIYKQIEEFEKNNFTIYKAINPKRNIFYLIRNVIPFFSKQYFMSDNINWIEYDFVYIRKGAVLDKSVIDLLTKIKLQNPQILIIMEIPTYPYINEFKGLLKWIIKSKEKLWVPKLKLYVDLFVTYSDDKKIYDIPCLNISNAYDFPERPPLIKCSSDSIQLLGVAALCFYHGYDRVIEGLNNYYQSSKSQRQIQFQLVGDGPVLKEYEQLVKKYQLEDKVTFHGRIAFSDLDRFYQTADIGIDSLARHRSGVFYNSSLKGKEYLAKGLPIISGVKTELDSENLSFYYKIPNDDTPLDIEKVVEWYDSLRKNMSKKELTNFIYKYGKSNYTFEKTFQPVVDYLKERETKRK